MGPFIFLFLCLVGILITYLSSTKYAEEWPSVLGVCMTAIFGIVTAFMVGATCVGYYSQIEAPFELSKLDEQEKIYQLKADVIINEIKVYLASSYPDHEKQVFEKLSRENANAVVDLYMVKYPELKANETFMSLSKSIQELRSKIYEVQLTRAQLKKDVRFRSRNPWIFNFLIPEVEV